jgi:lipoprotein-anchoring transpeptidase ErfK/SrfK
VLVSFGLKQAPDRACDHRDLNYLSGTALLKAGASPVRRIRRSVHTMCSAMCARKILSAWLLAAGLTSVFTSAAFANVDISVNKTTQHMKVSVDGSARYVWPVSTGRPGYNTPDGTFRPSWMAAMQLLQGI